jgi:hypothetical protein
MYCHFDFDLHSMPGLVVQSQLTGHGHVLLLVSSKLVTVRLEIFVPNDIACCARSRSCSELNLVLFDTGPA